MSRSTLTAVVHKERLSRSDKDIYVADCPEVGSVSQGWTIEEAVANLKEATELYLQEAPLISKGNAFITTFEVETGVRA